MRLRQWLCLVNRLAISVATLTMFTPVAALADNAQVTLENKSDRTLDLYIDDKYGCRALKNLFCTSQTADGQHTLYAMDGDQQYASKEVTLSAGESFTWTVK